MFTYPVDFSWSFFMRLSFSYGYHFHRFYSSFTFKMISICTKIFNVPPSSYYFWSYLIMSINVYVNQFGLIGAEMVFRLLYFCYQLYSIIS